MDLYVEFLVAVNKTASLCSTILHSVVERVQKWKMGFSLEIQKNSKILRPTLEVCYNAQSTYYDCAKSENTGLKNTKKYLRQCAALNYVPY
jgi:hypothetical protein